MGIGRFLVVLVLSSFSDACSGRLDDEMSFLWG